MSNFQISKILAIVSILKKNPKILNTCTYMSLNIKIIYISILRFI